MQGPPPRGVRQRYVGKGRVVYIIFFSQSLDRCNGCIVLVCLNLAIQWFGWGCCCCDADPEQVDMEVQR